MALKNSTSFLIFFYCLYFYFIDGYAAYWLSLKFGNEIGYKLAWIFIAVNDLIAVQIIYSLIKESKGIAKWFVWVTRFIALNWVLEAFLNDYKDQDWTKWDSSEIITLGIAFVMLFYKWKKLKSKTPNAL